MITARAIPLYLLFLVAGCKPSGVTGNHNDLPTVPPVVNQQDAALRVVFVAERRSSETEPEYVISVRNTSSQPCSIQAVGVVNAHEAPVSCRLLRLSSASIRPGSYDFAVLRVKGDTPSGASIYLDFEVDGATMRTEVPAVPTSRWASSLSFSRGLSTACFYARLSSRPVFAREDVASCSLNGIDAQITNVSYMPEVGGITLACIMLQPAQHFEQGETVAAELKLSNGDRFVYAKKAFVSCFVGKTQFDTQLRVVEMKSTEQELKLSLYNESDFSKSPLVIDAVRLDSVDITPDCELPQDPLPPDFHNYQTDVRHLSIPNPWAKAESRLVEIEFHLLEPKFGRPLPEYNRQRSIGFVVNRGMHTVIGNDYDPYLPGCTSIHNGGLRPHVNFEVIERRARALAIAGISIPVYARASSGVEAAEAAKMGAACDFMVISPGTRTGSVGENDISKTIEYYSRFHKRGIPFVASIIPDVASPYSPNDFRWCALAALCEGSRGILIRSTPDSNTESAWSNLRTVESIKDEWRPLSNVISLSEKVEISATTDRPGIHIGTLCCGCDQVILFALNEWCTRSSYQAHEPFYAVPRHGVEIELRLGAGWEDVKAEDAFSRSAVNIEQIGDGRCRLMLPPFEVGHVIVVSRDSAALPAGRPESTRELRTAERFETPALIPLESPFVDLGRRETGTSHAVEIPIRNMRSEAVKVSVEAISQSDSNPAHVDFAPMTIPANGEGILTGQLEVPPSEIPSLTRLRVSPSNSNKLGFEMFVAVEAYEMVQSDRRIVDFSQFTRIDKSNFRTVNMESEDPHFQIERVSGIDVPVEVELDSMAQSFRFRAIPRTHGPFTGNLEIRVLLPGHDNSIRKLTVPFAGRYAPEVAAEPRRILLWNKPERQTRKIALRHFENQALSILHTEGMAPWLSVRSYTSATTTRPVVEVAVLPGDQPVRDSVVRIDCRTEDGAKHSLSIPVKIVGKPGAITSDRTGMTEGDDSENREVVGLVNPRINGIARQVEKLLKTARAGDSPREMQNWLKMHRLLVLGDSAFLSGSAHTQEVINVVLHPSAAVGPFVIRGDKPFPRHSGERFDQEHHRDQFLHLLSMCGVPLDATLVVDQNQYQIRDLLDNSLRESRTTGELAWTVSAYACYLQPGQTWSNKFGEPMSLADLVESLLLKEEGACGGTHQMFAFSRVLARPELKTDKRLASVWQRLEHRVSIAVEHLQASQNPGGDFKIPANLRERLLVRESTPVRMGVYYTGHCLEWLVLALPEEQLSDPWVLRAVEYLAEATAADFVDAASTPFLRTDEARYQYGFQTHAIAALTLWHTRLTEQRQP